MAVTAAPPVAFGWATPEGWRSERIPFPLKFAPELPYRGVEELRFAPRFFKPDSETYFTYSFAFVLDPDGRAGALPFRAEQLAADLRTYFAGLTRAVGRHAVPAASHDATITAIPGGPAQRYRGTVRTVDGFGDGRALTLHVEGESFVCGSRRVILSSLSPRPSSDPIWPLLAAQRATFACGAPAH
jgi:hypothetical protein